MGAAAQNIMIVKAIQAAITANEDIRAEDLYFNLIAAPGYVEAIDEMLVLNEDRKQTAFVVGDTPFTLNATGTSLQNWATNASVALGNGADGLVSASKYFAAWYPSGLSTNVDGTDVVVPPSHMALRTIAYNDQVAYPWFAPAGLQRGIVNNAGAVGYVNASGQFITVKLNEGQRDILYINGINPIRVMPQGGIVIFGQKTRQPFASATDRINVVRLENYLRYQLNNLAQPFLFEPNDSTTRKAVKDAFDRFLSELITLRGLYDFLVVCDLSNNTPARIDRNELWIDIAIQPVKAIEFIYIPIRIRNTGASLT
jgi:phage tail sheath protein FI